MQKTLYLLSLLLFFTLSTRSLIAQSGDFLEMSDKLAPTFDAVSIRSIEKFHNVSSNSGLLTLTTPSKQCDYRADKVVCQLSLKRLVQEAFQLRKQEMPNFSGIDDKLFLLQALMPLNTNKETARLMLQQTLEDRFALKFHREAKAIRVYALIIGKQGAKLHPADDLDHRKPLNVATPGGRGAIASMSPGQFSAVAMSLDLLVDDLNTMAGMELPVINMTGLSGEYKIDLHWTPEEDEQSSSFRILDSGFPVAVQNQLGLKLEKRTVTGYVFVIDEVSSIPTEN